MRLTLTAVIVLMTLSVGLGARAETEKEKAAIAAFTQGVKLFKEEQYKDAVEHFRKANELNPSWKIQYNIAQCEAALKRYGLAIEAFERYLGEGGDEVPAERRDEVLAELDRLRKMVGSVKVQGPNGIDVVIDQVVMGQTPLKSGILVTAGVEHWIWLVKDGKKLMSVKETVRGGETLELNAPGSASSGAAAQPPPVRRRASAPPPAAAAPPPATAAADPAPAETTATTPEPEDTSAPPPQAETGKKKMGPALFAVGIAGAVAFGGVALAMGLVVDSKWDEASSDYNDNPWGYSSSAADEIKTLQIVGYVSMALSGAMLVMGVVAAPFTDFSSGKSNVALSLDPWGTDDGGGLALQGRF